MGWLLYKMPAQDVPQSHFSYQRVDGLEQQWQHRLHSKGHAFKVTRSLILAPHLCQVLSLPGPVRQPAPVPPKIAQLPNKAGRYDESDEPSERPRS